MAYMKVIEESGVWICPKTAEYKVMCIAGGDSCAGATGGQKFGSPTSFGKYLTASGRYCNAEYTWLYEKRVNSNGYTLVNNRYGDITLYNNKPWSGGYGAGGCDSNTSGAYTDGFCGKMEVSFVSIEAGENVICTIGSGGKVDSPSYSINNANISGVDGVIIIQEV